MERSTHRRPPLGNYGLSIVLACMFLVSWIAQFVTQYFEAQNEATAHGEPFVWNEFWPMFGAATFENWQSEFLQLLAFVVLTTYLIHRGSAESRDGDDELKDQLDRIEARLQHLQTVDLRERDAAGLEGQPLTVPTQRDDAPHAVYPGA